MTENQRQSGFTLLEIVLASSMVSIIALSLFMSVRIAFRARDSAMNAVGPLRAAHLAMDLICQDLESALSPNGAMVGAFYGQHDNGVGGVVSDAVEFYCVGNAVNSQPLSTGIAGAGGGDGNPLNLGGLPMDPGLAGGIHRIDLAVTTSGQSNAPVLVRRTTSNLLAPTVPTPDEEILCRGVKSFSVLYYDGSGWADTWDSTTEGDILPVAAEIVLVVDLTSERPGTTSTYRLSRTVLFPCHKDADTTNAGGTGATGTTGVIR